MKTIEFNRDGTGSVKLVVDGVPYTDAAKRFSARTVKNTGLIIFAGDFRWVVDDITLLTIDGSPAVSAEEAAIKINECCCLACCGCGGGGGEPVFRPPVFLTFFINPATRREIGEPLSAGTVFNWTVTNSGNVKPASLFLKNETVGVDVATGLSGLSYTLSSALTGRTTVGIFEFSINGIDLQNNIITPMSLEVEFGMNIITGASIETEITAAHLASFTTKQLKMNMHGDYQVPGNTMYQYLAIPVDFGIPVSFIDPASGFDVPMTQQAGTLTIQNQHGINVEYNVWRSVNILFNGFTIRI